MQDVRETLPLTLDTDDFRRLVVDPPVIERLATGFRFVEGPVWDAEGEFLLFSDIPANTIYRWSEADGTSVWRHPSGHSNGNTRDQQGRLLTCEHSNRRVTRMDAQGDVGVLASHYEGKRLNSPNDIVVKSDGMIYFTDPTYGLNPDEGDGGTQELPWQGVYRLTPDTLELTLLVNYFSAPNGLAFSPDESRLYVDDSEDMLVRVYDVQEDGLLSGGRVLIDGMGTHGDGRGVPDGMKVDSEGNLWVTGPDGVWVIHPDGQLLGVLPVPELAANLNWGGLDRRTLYITASTSLYRVRLTVAGA